MLPVLHLTEEKSFSLVDLTNNMVNVIQEKIEKLESHVRGAANYLKSKGEIEAEFDSALIVATPGRIDPDFFPFGGNIDNLDGYIYTQNPGIDFSGFMEENY